MEKIKISDAEFPLMEYIWENQPLSASALADFALGAFGWKKNTTYTVLKRLNLRGAIERSEPGFIVRAIVTREDAQRTETDELIQKAYRGSAKLFLASFLSREDISGEELQFLKGAVDKLDKKE